jgi:hypothetical protein
VQVESLKRDFVPIDNLKDGTSEIDAAADTVFGFYAQPLRDIGLSLKEIPGSFAPVDSLEPRQVVITAESIPSKNIIIQDSSFKSAALSLAERIKSPLATLKGKYTEVDGQRLLESVDLDSGEIFYFKTPTTDFLGKPLSTANSYVIKVVVLLGSNIFYFRPIEKAAKASRERKRSINAKLDKLFPSD